MSTHSTDATPDRFSPLAATYARVRPRYPEALYDWLASLVDRHELAWDCATGNGQAALGVAERFRHVVATDRSAEQLRRATGHPRIEYRLAPADASGLADASVDLVTVAAALHWLPHEAFFAEVARVVRPGGVLAAWSYHTAVVDPPFDKVFHRAYWDVLKPYFSRETEHVDRRYESIALPGEPIAAPDFALEVDWRLDQALDYIRSWSAAHAWEVALGTDPAEPVREEMEAIFGDRARTMTLRIPIFVRAVRLG